MDSLTQIALGAAVGEVVAGKKIGNRALFWGAVAGTIPDLDIIGNLFMTEIQSLAFHRGFSHSFVFSIIGAFGFGWLVDQIYKSKNYKHIAFGTWSSLLLLLFVTVNLGNFGSTINLMGVLLSLILLVPIFYFYRKYFTSDRQNPISDFKTYRNLFFWSIVTHPILDSFTVYGTQLFLPFSNDRVGFNNIAVADPMYTVPLLLGIIICSYLSRNSTKRRIINYVGIGMSSMYMMFTIWNKHRVNHIYTNSLIAQNIEVQRFMTGPTILNNVLWNCIAETEEHFLIGQYSFFDKRKEIKFDTFPKNWHLISPKPDDNTINTLQWFSNNYYALMIKDDGTLQINDLRYGATRGKDSTEDDYIFRFGVEKSSDGYYHLTESDGGPPRGKEKETFTLLWERIKGI